MAVFVRPRCTNVALEDGSVELVQQAVDVFTSAGVGMYVLDPDGAVVAANPAAVALLGWSAEQLAGRHAHDTIHADAGTSAQCPLSTVAQTEHTLEADSDLFRRADGSLLPVWWISAPLTSTTDASERTASAADGHGSTMPAPSRGAVVVFGDITAREAVAVADAAAADQVRADLHTARETASELGWAAEVTQALASAPDEAEALRRLARMCVPRLADIAICDRIGPDGGLERIGNALAPGLELDLPELLARADVAHRGGGAATTRRTVGRATDPFVLDRAQTQDPDVFDAPSRTLLNELDATSTMIVPLWARGRQVAVTALVRRAARAGFTDHEQLVARDLARRAGLALDNLRLLATERSTTTVLQQALLPTLPDNLGIELAATYLPAQDTLRVGGDWYDAFACIHNSTQSIVVIGDVAGHDLAAATTMASLRNLLRGVAISADITPGVVLSTVDTSMRALGITGTATTVVLAVRPAEPDPRENIAGSASWWRVEWSNAGHLPPVLLRPDGTVQFFEAAPDPLLGAGVSRSTRATHHQLVPAGSAVLLYTDGLIEKRAEDIDVSLTLLLRAAHAANVAGDRSPRAMLDAILGQLPRSPDDDTAAILAYLP